MAESISYEINDAISRLKELGAKRVFIQYPEGIKRRILDVVSSLEKEGIETVLCLESTWGACDIREYEAGLFKCDAMLHIGHSDYGVKTKMPIVYMDWFTDVPVEPVLEKNFDRIEKFNSFGLVTSIQFARLVEPARKFLESRGKKVHTYKSQKYEGQILGCRHGAGLEVEGNVDAFICISAGRFYGLGLALQTDKPMLNLDLERMTIEDMSSFKKKIQKVAAWNISALKDANKVGFIVSWKRGQMFGSPFILKKKLEKQGKKVFVFAVDELSIPKIEGLKVDALVNFACPRIGTDDLEKYKVPIVNYVELMKQAADDRMITRSYEKTQ